MIDPSSLTISTSVSVGIAPMVDAAFGHEKGVGADDAVSRAAESFVAAAKAASDPVNMVQVFRGGCMYMVPEVSVTTACCDAHWCTDDGAVCIPCVPWQGSAEALDSGAEAFDSETGAPMADLSHLVIPTLVTPGPRRRTLRSLFMSDGLYEYYQNQVRGRCAIIIDVVGQRSSHAVAVCLCLSWQNRLLLGHVDPKDPRYKELPPQFTSMVPLDAATKTRGTTGSFGYVTVVYKVRWLV